ncbi:MAG: ribosome silencing factor [Saprospiraceae bacterium]|nr:ribosome silencing factor [Saprospiraceae bacterium]MDP4820912.1 ribosome silencing factor [Saprospiraceae bacterium]MDP4999941.1 ribosome silencing factor [Saprospiraceae bacterium]
MNKEVNFEQPVLTIEVINDFIIDAIQDIKGKNIVKLDLRKIEDAPADFFIICEGDSTTQVKAISDNVHQRLKRELEVFPNHIEGEKAAQWICLDYFFTVVHVFHREAREFYELEQLWGDAISTTYETL